MNWWNSLFYSFHLPKAVIQVMAIFNTDAFVDFGTAKNQKNWNYIGTLYLEHSKTHISSVDIEVIPMASAYSFPSAIIATTWPLSTGVMHAPGDVNPGHMIFAPLNTKRIAPLSTCSIGKKNGNLCKRRSVGIHGPSRWRKNNWSPTPLIRISMWSWHLTILNASFFGSITSMYFSRCENCSNNFVRMFFCTEDFNCCVPEMLSFSSNLKFQSRESWAWIAARYYNTYFLNISIAKWYYFQWFWFLFRFNAA